MTKARYAVVDPDTVTDSYAGSQVPGEFRRLTGALGCEQLSSTLIRIPAHSDFEQGTGLYHDEVEELYLVTRGTLTMRFGDVVEKVSAPAAVRVSPATPRSHRNEGDDPGVYHLFYGDEHARPGADLTFFEYPGAKPGLPGAGMVHRIVHRVGDSDALSFWAARLKEEGVAVELDQSLRFADPEGLGHEFVVDGTDDVGLAAVHPQIPADFALRGFEGVRAYSADPSASAVVLQRLMGATRVDG